MVKILFVCHGNICRSPMAKYILKSLVDSNKVFVESRATSNEEIGNDLYYLAKEILNKNNIPFDKHEAIKLTKEDYNNYDYIYGFDDENIYNMNILFDGDKDNKIKLLNGIIEDPWYTRDFDKCFKEIYKGCKSIINEMK